MSISEEILASPVAEQWAQVLIHFLWQGVVLAAVYAVGLLLAFRRSSNLRYAWGVGCLVALASCPLLTLLLVRVPVSEFVVFDQIARTDWLGSRWAMILESVKPWVLAAWFAGAVTIAVRLTFGNFALLWICAQRQPLTGYYAQRAERLRRRLGLSARVVIASSADITGAIATGVIRPMVLVPASWLTKLSPEMLEAVLAHELAHIRRWDLWVNLFQCVVESLFFYHPVVWWISHRIRRDREKCCDELAVKVTENRVDYVRALEFLAAARLVGTRPASLAAGIGEEKMFLLDRVRNVLEANNWSRRIGLIPGGVALMIATFVLCLATRNSNVVVAEEVNHVAQQTQLEDDGDCKKDKDCERDGKFECEHLYDYLLKPVLNEDCEDGCKKDCKKGGKCGGKDDDSLLSLTLLEDGDGGCKKDCKKGGKCGGKDDDSLLSLALLEDGDGGCKKDCKKGGKCGGKDDDSLLSLALLEDGDGGCKKDCKKGGKCGGKDDDSLLSLALLEDGDGSCKKDCKKGGKDDSLLYC